MFLIVGLGNPGKKYEQTYHNVGFLTVEKLACDFGAKFNESECIASVAKCFVHGEKIVFAKPQTFMNNSGDSVSQLVKKYKIEAKKLIIIYDDIDIDAPKLRIRNSGTAGCHNGMKSVIASLPYNDFVRMRIGTGPQPEGDLADFVLSKIPKKKVNDDMPSVCDGIDKAYEATKCYIETGDIDMTMQKFSK